MFAVYFLFFLLVNQSISQAAEISLDSTVGQPDGKSGHRTANLSDACTKPFFLFDDPFYFFGERRFPVSKQPSKILIGSWVDRCPIDQSNFQSNPHDAQDRYSCCNDESVKFVQNLLEDYAAERIKLVGLTQKLTTEKFYGILTNQSSNPQSINQSVSQLTMEQYQAVQQIQESITSSIDLGVQCADHWMGYVSGLFCLGCDPVGSLKYVKNSEPFDQSVNQSINHLFKSSLTQLSLDPTTCDKVFNYCGPFIQSVFLSLQSLPSNLVLVGSLNEYPRWYNIQVLIDAAFDSVKQSINVDMCYPGDCQSWFCQGSVMEEPDFDVSIDLADDANVNINLIHQPTNQSTNQSINQSACKQSSKLHQHGFRGLNYRLDTSTFDRLIDVQSVVAYAICLMRWGYQRDESFDPASQHTDGCPRHSNLLYLLGEAGMDHDQFIPNNQSISQSINQNNQSVYPLVTVPTSQCVPHTLVACSFGDSNSPPFDSPDRGTMCFPRYAHCRSWSQGINDLDCPSQPECSINGLAFVSFPPDGYQAYEVGCHLAINLSICAPPIEPPSTGVTHKYVYIFAITISVGVSLLICVIVYCYVQHRRALSQQRWSALRDWRSNQGIHQWADRASSLIGRHRPSISETQSPLEDRSYRPLMND